MATIGILYIAIGESYLQEALRSLRSLRKYCPDIDVCIKTHREIELEDLHCRYEVIDPTSDPKSEKISHLSKTPFDHTLFLDTDTYICEDISGMFELLKRFELSVAFALKQGERQLYNLDCPDCFIEMNTGVLLFRNCESVRDLFVVWKKRHQEHLESGVTTRDQPAFREVLYHSNVIFSTLPNEYNFRVNKVNSARSDYVYILHGRNVNMEKLASRINRSVGRRAYFPYMQAVFSTALVLGTEADGWMQKFGKVFRGVLSLRLKRSRV